SDWHSRSKAEKMRFMYSAAVAIAGDAFNNCGSCATVAMKKLDHLLIYRLAVRVLQGVDIDHEFFRWPSFKHWLFLLFGWSVANDGRAMKLHQTLPVQSLSHQVGGDFYFASFSNNLDD